MVRWISFIAVLALVIPGTFYGLSKLKPAAPGVDMSALWPDTAKRGAMVLEVHGLGTLVPEETMLITATTDGRVAHPDPARHAGQGRFGGHDPDQSRPGDGGAGRASTR